MSFSAANDIDLSGGGVSSSAAAAINTSSAYGAGSANASPVVNTSFGNRSILKERNSNDNINMASPLSSKTPLNNSKPLTPSSSTTVSASSSQMHTPKTPTSASSCNTAAAAQNVSPGVFEENSTLHKFPIDPELETGLFDDHHQVSVNELQNTSGVNKSSNKFVGLTEFDEAKIPDLPGDLNPNIEDQYNVTFEECFIPTLTAKQGTTNELALEKTHLLLPNEANTSVSTVNESFSDCLDEGDPLAATYLEQPNMCDTTADGDGYESAVNDITKDCGMADVTMELDVNPIQIVENIEVISELTTSMDWADEPMDIDMNATVEIIQKSAENIQNVERVLHHAENILQHLDEEKETMAEENQKENLNEDAIEAKVIGSLAKTESSKMTFVISATTAPVQVAPQSQHLEIEQSNHDVSLNKSVEIPVNKAASLSSECVITAVNNEVAQIEIDASTSQLDNLELSKGLAMENQNLTSNNKSSCSSSNASVCRSPTPKMNSALNMNPSTGNLKNSAPTSPAFPIKQSQIGQTFPKSPKSKMDNSNKLTFMEKSDYVEKLEQKLNSKLKDAANETHESNENGTFLEPQPTMNTNQRRTFAIESITQSDGNHEKQSENNRRTFNVENADVSPNTGMGFPTKSNTDTSRRTFCINDVSDKSSVKNDNTVSKEKLVRRQTFNISKDEVQSTPMDTSFEPMDIDQNLSQTNTLNVETNSERELKTQISQSLNLSNMQESHDSCTTQDTSDMAAMEERTQSAALASVDNSDLACVENVPDVHPLPAITNEQNLPHLSCMPNRSDSPPLPIMQKRSNSPLSMQNNTDSPTLPAMHNISESIPLQDSSLNTMQNRSVSPPLPTMQNRPNSPLSKMQNNTDSPTLPALQNISDSLPLQDSSLTTIQNRSDSPPLPTMQNRLDSPTLSTMQNRLDSPTLPTMHIRSDSPPKPIKQIISDLPALPNPKQRSVSPPLPAIQTKTIMADQSSHEQDQYSEMMSASSSSFTAHSPPLPDIQKRPPIHGFGCGEILSAKEQSNNKIKDEKDEFVEKFTPSPLEDIFTTVSATSTTLTNTSGFSSFDQSSTTSPTVNNGGQQPVDDDDEFQGNNNLILNPSDFDYLLTKGNNNTPVDRSSLLLKFDPLLGVPVPSNQGQQQLLHLQIPTNNLNNNPCLSPTIEEDEHNDSTNRSFVVENASSNAKSLFLCGLGRGAAGSASSLSSSAKSLKERPQEVKQQLQQPQQNPQIKRQLPKPVNKKNATMSVDVIKDMSLDNNDCNKTFEHSNSTQSDDKQINYKMDELEKKIKNEVLKTEDIEKKLKDAEQREEALIKRITEKDKTVAKMTGVIEAYEKAIAELIAEKEQLIQSYEKQLAEVKADRDSNYHHLTSLETTFSDLHVKYEKSKEMTCQLKGNEEALLTENRKNLENLRLQEQRYDKMKNHAMQQLEIANKKLECLTREHSMETTKLKALLKKEEIARSSMSEQLAQKTKENTELVKICDELIQGQGS